MQEVKQKEDGLPKELWEALQEVFFGGERILLRAGGMEVGLVPSEELEVLEEIEAPGGG